MSLTRRMLFAVPFARPASAAPARGFLVEQSTFATLRRIDTPGAVLFPALRARLVTSVRLDETDAAVIAFGADSADGVLDMLAVVAAQGPGLRVAALEVKSWHGAWGSLSTRLTAVNDGQRLRLERDGTTCRQGRRWHEAWTDYLRWRSDAPMQDAPMRPPLEDTLQARLAALRADTMAWPGLRLGDLRDWPPPNASSPYFVQGHVAIPTKGC